MLIYKRMSIPFSSMIVQCFIDNLNVFNVSFVMRQPSILYCSLGKSFENFQFVKKNNPVFIKWILIIWPVFAIHLCLSFHLRVLCAARCQPSFIVKPADIFVKGSGSIERTDSSWIIKILIIIISIITHH